MIPVQVFDDFAGDAAAVRKAVIEGGFESKQGPDGALYTGISTFGVPHWYARIAELVGGPIYPKLTCFRLNLAGELPHSWVHSDDICAKWASVLYLNRPEDCAGGTAFWKHRALGMDRLLTREELLERGMDPDSFYKLMNQEWRSLEHWEQTELIPMKWNRFVTYPTSYFHSRYPFEGFGHGGWNGRLIWVCFYDKEER